MNKSPVIYEYSTRQKLVDIVDLIACAYYSDLLLSNPLFGMALYIAAAFWVLFFRMRFSGVFSLIGKGARITNAVLPFIAVIFNALLLFLYPQISQNQLLFYVIGFTLLIVGRSVVTDIISYKVKEQKTKKLLFAHMLFLTALIVVCSIMVSFSDVLIGTLIFVITSVLLLREQRADKDDFSLRKITTVTQINSYKLFSNMTLYAYAALFTGPLMFLEYMTYLPQRTGFGIYYAIIGWLGLFTALLALFGKLLKRSKKSEKMSLFIIGAVLSIFASIMVFRFTGVFEIVVIGAVWALGFAMMQAVIAKLSDDFQLVARLVDETVQKDDFKHNNAAIQNIALMLAEMVALCVFTVHNLVTGSRTNVLQLSIEADEQYLLSALVLVPMVFLAVAVVFAVRQPLDEKTKERLLSVSGGTATDEMRRWAKKVLVSKYRKRIGVKIVIMILRPLLRHKVCGTENVNVDELPAVFVCNHGEIYGPVVATLYLPYYFRAWADVRMMDKTHTFAHVYNGMFSKIKYLPSFVSRFFAKIASHLSVWALNSIDSIPVYRDSIKSIFKTFDLSVSAMLEGDSILIFPENPATSNDGRYADVGVNDFFTGFAHLGTAYYKKSGLCTTFYPIYANKKKRTFTIGPGTKFNPEEPSKDEKERIACFLREKINEMTEKAY